MSHGGVLSGLKDEVTGGSQRAGREVQGGRREGGEKGDVERCWSGEKEEVAERWDGGEVEVCCEVEEKEGRNGMWRGGGEGRVKGWRGRWVGRGKRRTRGRGCGEARGAEMEGTKKEVKRLLISYTPFIIIEKVIIISVHC